jgi:hypothetical protein
MSVFARSAKTLGCGPIGGCDGGVSRERARHFGRVCRPTGDRAAYCRFQGVDTNGADAHLTNWLRVQIL